jgi:hypothetical protein
VSNTLTRLYEGLRRAEAEEEPPTGVPPRSEAGPAGEEAAPGAVDENDKVSTVGS